MSVFYSRRVCYRASCESRRALLVSLALAVALYATIFEYHPTNHTTARPCFVWHGTGLHFTSAKSSGSELFVALGLGSPRQAHDDDSSSTKRLACFAGIEI